MLEIQTLARLGNLLLRITCCLGPLGDLLRNQGSAQVGHVHFAALETILPCNFCESNQFGTRLGTISPAWGHEYTLKTGELQEVTQLAPSYAEK